VIAIEIKLHRYQLSPKVGGYGPKTKDQSALIEALKRVLDY
jgi:hypothetical protein